MFNIGDKVYMIWNIDNGWVSNGIHPHKLTTGTIEALVYNRVKRENDVFKVKSDDETKQLSRNYHEAYLTFIHPETGQDIRQVVELLNSPKKFKIGDKVKISENEDDPYIPCYNCKSEFCEDELLSQEGYLYCQDCHNELFFTCDECIQVFNYDDSISDGQDNLICRDCFDENHFTCRHCNKIGHINDAIRYNSDIYHRDCFYENHFTCDNCGENFHNDDYDTDGYCVNCNSESNSNTIKDYGYKPKPEFKHLTKELDKVYMGVELEIEINEDDDRDNVAESIKHNGELYFKDDGSIIYGFEIVTHPLTLAYHKSSIEWSKILTKLSRDGARSHDVNSCGLHIHVSKKPFSEIEKIRLGIFVNLHSDKFEKIARRSSKQWSKFKYIKGGNADNNRNERGENLGSDGSYLKLTHNDNRYEALNWQNDKTIEFRMYKGTLKPDTFLGTLEITHAVCYFVKSVNSTLQLIDKKKSWELFIKFIEKNKKQYSYAFKYLQSKNLIVGNKKVNAKIEDVSTLAV